jgi:hypothetical protein
VVDERSAAKSRRKKNGRVLGPESRASPFLGPEGRLGRISVDFLETDHLRRERAQHIEKPSATIRVGQPLHVQGHDGE